MVRRAREGAVEILDHDRHTAERAVGKNAVCRDASAFEERMDDGVQLVIALLDARNGGIHELDRRSGAGPDELGLGRCVEM